MGRYQAYPQYKDSGVEWLGEVPSHWAVCRLGDYALKIGSGKTPKGGSEIYQDDGVLFLRSQNIYDDGLRIEQAESVYISEAIDADMAITRVQSGDILLNITGGSIGRTCIVPAPFPPANVNQHVCIVRMPNELRNFTSFFMKSTSLKEQIDFLQNGGNREGLNFEQIRKFSTVIPSADELEKIANFLDHETAKIDTLIEQQQQLIQLLKEKRFSLIDLAIKDAPDVRLENCAEIVVRPIIIRPDELYVPIGLYNRGRGIFHKDPTLAKDLGDSDFSYIEDTDLIFSGQFAWEGAVALADKEDNGCVASHRYPILRGLDGLMDNGYLWAFFTSSKGDFLLDENSRGSAGRNRPLNINYLMKEKIPLPSMAAQLQVSKIVRQEKIINEKIKEVIKRLEERRTALISAVVTGKIDVRNWQPPQN